MANFTQQSLNVLPDILLSTKWSLEITQMPFDLPGVDKATFDVRSVSADFLKDQAIPLIDVNVKDTHSTAHGTQNPTGTGTITFIERSDMLVTTIAQMAKTMNYDVETGVGSSQADYKRMKITLRQLDRLNNELARYVVEGVSILDYTPANIFQSGEDQIVQVAWNISYDNSRRV